MAYLVQSRMQFDIPACTSLSGHGMENPGFTLYCSCGVFPFALSVHVATESHVGLPTTPELTARKEYAIVRDTSLQRPFLLTTVFVTVLYSLKEDRL